MTKARSDFLAILHSLFVVFLSMEDSVKLIRHSIHIPHKQLISHHHPRWCYEVVPLFQMITNLILSND